MAKPTLFPESLVRSGTALLKELGHRSRAWLPTATAIDALLGGGLFRGALVEMVGEASSGRFAIVLATLAAVTRTGQMAVLIDLGDHLDPQAAQALGVELPRLLWLRPQCLEEALASTEIAMDLSPSLVVLDLGLRRCRTDRWQSFWVRLERVAAARSVALLVSTSEPVCGFTAEAAIAVNRVRAHWGTRGPRLLQSVVVNLVLMKQRGHLTARDVTLALAPVESLAGVGIGVGVDGVGDGGAPQDLDPVAVDRRASHELRNTA